MQLVLTLIQAGEKVIDLLVAGIRAAGLKKQEEDDALKFLATRLRSRADAVEAVEVIELPPPT